MSQKLRQEINALVVKNWTQNGTQFPDFNNYGLINLDTSKYNGSPAYWFEAVYSGAASNTGSIRLRRFGTTTDDATINGATDANWHMSRVQFTPPAGATDYMAGMVGDGVRDQSLAAARIIILQDETAITKTETQIEIGNYTSSLTNTAVADITNPKFWKYTAANWDGTKTFSVEAVWKTSAKNTCTITLCRTSDNAANVTIVSAGTSSTGPTKTRVSFTPVDGETYKIRCLGSTTKSTYNISTAKIIVDQSVNPTKCEPQYLLLNTPDSNATGVQNYFTTWNSSEWDAGSGSISYYHAMDSDNASNSIKLRDVTAGADVSNGTVTGSGQQVSAALGAFTNGNNLDCWVLNTTGIIAASRILVQYAFVAAPTEVIPDLIMAPLLPPRRFRL